MSFSFFLLFQKVSDEHRKSDTLHEACGHQSVGIFFACGSTKLRILRSWPVSVSRSLSASLTFVRFMHSKSLQLMCPPAAKAPHLSMDLSTKSQALTALCPDANIHRPYIISVCHIESLRWAHACCAYANVLVVVERSWIAMNADEHWKH